MAIIITPNMNLPVPIVGQEIGPQYATDINNCMSLIDSHNHTPGNGVQLTQDSILINGDLSMQGNRITSQKSSTFSSQVSPLAGVSPDIGALYVSGVDLYYNDVNGNQIRMTASGSVNSGNGNISGLVPPATATYSPGLETFIWESNVNTPAAMDNGPVTIREITASPKGVTINSPSGLAADYGLTLPSALPSLNSSLMVDSLGNITPRSMAGVIEMFAGAVAPAGRLLCDGSAVSRVTYAQLFSVIGSNYGDGDGSTTFNLPDLRGLFPRGVDNGAGNDPDASSRTAQNPGGNTGDNVGSVQLDAVGSHTHNISGGVTLSGSPTQIAHFAVTGTAAISTNAQSPSPTETRPKNVYVNFVIWY